MTTIRRWYIYLVCAISLQSVIWAVIQLLRGLLVPSTVLQRAFEIAVILVGLPIFLVHWIWIRNLARKDPEEQQSSIRSLYLYGMLAGFLGPFLANAYTFINQFFLLVLREKNPDLAISPVNIVIRSTVALIILAAIWFYHNIFLKEDLIQSPEKDARAIIRRLYIFSFCAIGLFLTAYSSIHILRWIMYLGRFNSDVYLSTELARLFVGLPLWLIFWLWAQRKFRSPDPDEKSSSLRKFYLYAVIFVSVLTTVTNAALLLVGAFRRMLQLSSLGDIRDPLPILIIGAVVWGYHAIVLQSDAAQAGEAPLQSGIRRLYRYLVAAIGLASLLIGLSGIISVLIRSIGNSSDLGNLKDQLAWFASALVAGLPVWGYHWRSIQLEASVVSNAGNESRQTIVRKIYLYFYLFVATMTVLASAVYIVFRVVSMFLGENAPTFSGLGQALSFLIIAVGVWLYHGFTLRSDTGFNRRVQAEHLALLHVVIVDQEENQLGQAILDGLNREFPNLFLDKIIFKTEASSLSDLEIARDNTLIEEAGLIIIPWYLTVPEMTSTPELAHAISSSPARKLLLPIWRTGWDWSGADRLSQAELVKQTIHAVRQIAADKEVIPVRPLGAGVIIAIIIGVLVIVPMLISLIGGLFTRF